MVVTAAVLSGCGDAEVTPRTGPAEVTAGTGAGTSRKLAAAEEELATLKEEYQSWAHEFAEKEVDWEIRILELESENIQLRNVIKEKEALLEAAVAAPGRVVAAQQPKFGTDAPTVPKVDPRSLVGRHFDQLQTNSGDGYTDVTVLEAAPAWLRVKHADGLSKIGFGDLPEDVQVLVAAAFPPEAAIRSPRSDGEEEGAGAPYQNPIIPDPVAIELPPQVLPGNAFDAAEKSGEAALRAVAEQTVVKYQASVDARKRHLKKLNAKIKEYREKHAEARRKGRISSWSAVASRYQTQADKMKKEIKILEMKLKAYRQETAALRAGGGRSKAD